MNIHIIVNKLAGSGKAEKMLELIKAHLEHKKIAYSVAVSEYAGHSTLLAKNACENGESRIVSIGGDGTTREVAAGMLYSGIPLGIIPAGTGNDFARVLGIPSDPVEAIALALKDDVKTVDGAKANDKFFFNVAGLGFDVDVLIAEKKFRKHINNSLSYILGLMRALFKLAPHHIKIIGENDAQTFESNALIALAGNGRYIGGGLMLTPLANPSDGFLDICVVSNISRFKVLPVLVKALKGKHLDSKYTKYFLAKEITITAETPQPVQLDGEIIESTPVTFKILPAALKVFC